MSQYQSSRSTSYATSCGAISTRPSPENGGRAGCVRSVTLNGPGAWSLSEDGANGGSQVPDASGALRASGKSARVGPMPETKGLAQAGSFAHCVMKFL